MIFILIVNECCRVHHYINSLNCKNIKCFFCGKDVEVKNTFKHEEAIFDEDLNRVNKLDQYSDINSFWNEDGTLIYLS